ncbi:alpha/beta fold hydrolase [Streptomyces sp. ML-6]|uniref:thioesterase II family protein n=1 Tax=unclassified Streptomyces TaxID=2593676 RepID=UPI0024C01050|nr:alpha/beta fold hydrolase [Streptomyces sp. ML-6]MDK0524703.1 alpha/beta fold hydrolase [Streptomyces sp. ML-6]
MRGVVGNPVEETAWVRRFHPSPEARYRLLCFPHSGGSASFFFPFSHRLAPEIDVWSMQYPGRQDRRSEANIPHIHELADRVVEAVGPCLDGPYALFGHSMGATLAYEVALRLQSDGKPPEALFVSGRPAPHRNVDKGLHRLSDEEMADDIRALDGTGSEMFGDADVLKMFLPAIRSDYHAAETYEYTPGPVLKCPIRGFTGFSDPRVEVGELHHWSDHTEGPFELDVFSGGHFYLVDGQEDMAVEIERTLRGAGHR